MGMWLVMSCVIGRHRMWLVIGMWFVMGVWLVMGCVIGCSVVVGSTEMRFPTFSRNRNGGFTELGI